MLFNIVAVVSLRWFATAAAAGPSSITLWVLAALLFFVPQGLAVSDLAARYPEEGGIYVWTKRAFGEGHGFLCGWCYWVNNILYYPNLLMSTAVDRHLRHRAGRDRPCRQLGVRPARHAGGALAGGGDQHRRPATGRWLQNLGAIGTYLPGVAACRRSACTRRHPAGRDAAHRAIARAGPRRSLELNLWASIAFAFAGLELCA